MRRIQFFSTPSDIKPVLRRFEASAPLKYGEDGKCPSPIRPVYLSFEDIPDVGIVNKPGGDYVSYVVSSRAGQFVVDRILQNSGKMAWFLCNGDNEDSVDLMTGGVTRTDALLPGKVSTLHEMYAAQLLMKRFLRALQQERFRRVDEFWLGPEALEMARAGKRLTASEEGPREFDFCLPEGFR